MSVSSEDSIDEDLEENLPICVQGSLTKLRRQCSKLRQIKSNLTSQLEKSELRCQELARQVETLESQLSNCVQCQKLQLQLDEVGERLGNGQLSWAPSEVVSVTTQTGDDFDQGGDWSLEGEEDIAAQVPSVFLLFFFTFKQDKKYSRCDNNRFLHLMVTSSLKPPKEVAVTSKKQKTILLLFSSLILNSG